MTGPTQPLTLGQIEASAEHYGVKIAAIGEDGDMGFAAFTHDRRRAIAALHRLIRVDWESGPVKRITVEKTAWWLVFDNCGHGDTCPHVEDADGFIEHDGCTHNGLAPCREDQLGWLGLAQDQVVEGAVPVIELEASY